MRSQSRKALAASRFNQGPDNQGVDETPGFAGAHMLAQALGITRRRHMVIGNATLTHDLQHLLEMQQLLAGKLAQGIQ